MTSSEQRVQDWFISETHLLSDGRLKLFPETSVFSRLTEGKNKRIWKYVVDHVRSRCTAEKVRRILTVKENHHELESPYAFPDTNHHLQKIAKAKEKRSFLEGSLSEIKKEIESAESEVQKLSDKICTINQKCAMLELISTEYRQKAADMNCVKSMLSFHFNRNTKPNQDFYLSLNIPNVTKVSSNKLKFRDNPECDQVKYVLRQIASQLTDSKSCQISDSFRDDVKKRVDHMIKTYSLADIFVILKELSNMSYMQMMSRETYSQSPQEEVSQTAVPISSKCLKDMKLEFIQSSFNTRKTNKEIEKLHEERKQLLKKLILKTDDTMNEKKFQLFEMVAENESLSACIEFLESALINERNEVELLKKDVDKESNSNNFVSVIDNFYTNFDKLCLLLKSGPNLHSSILKMLSNLYKFVNEQMFSNTACPIMEYPFRIKQDLKCDIQTMWSVLEKNNILNPLVPCLFSINCFEPESLTKMLGLSKFESECIIGYKIKNLKDKVINNQDKEFKFDEDVASQALQKYILMTKTLQTMQQKLELCSRNFMESSEQSRRTEIVLEDWWKQGAQFIPQIDYDGKSLKMWIDILLVLPELLTTDV